MIRAIEKMSEGMCTALLQTNHTSVIDLNRSSHTHIPLPENGGDDTCVIGPSVFTYLFTLSHLTHITTNAPVVQWLERYRKTPPARRCW